MLTIGLTGGIACGKSTASAHLARLGAHRIDADRLARQVVAPGKPALAEISAAFGPGLIRPDGTLDRKALGGIVFSSPSRLKKLNSIVHPYIFEEQSRQIDALAGKSDNPADLTIVVDAALLIETGRHTTYDLVLVAYCPERIQMRRLRARDGFSRDQALQRILRQMPLLEKVDYADFVISTSGSKAETRRHIEYLWKIIQLERDRWLSRK